MIRGLRLNYVLATPETWEKIELACSELGWPKSTILKQMIHGFMRRDGQFYARAALSDAQARGLAETDYFRTLRDEGIDKLKPYLNGKPAFGRTPIEEIADVPTGTDYRHRYNVIEVSAYNYVLLRVAQIVHTDSLVQIVSKMVVKHLEDNWQSVYEPQIERDKACRFL